LNFEHSGGCFFILNFVDEDAPSWSCLIGVTFWNLIFLIDVVNEYWFVFLLKGQRSFDNMLVLLF